MGGDDNGCDSGLLGVTSMIKIIINPLGNVTSYSISVWMYVYMFVGSCLETKTLNLNI